VRSKMIQLGIISVVELPDQKFVIWIGMELTAQRTAKSKMILLVIIRVIRRMV
jgi:uncharacterized membrane protein